MPIHLSDWAQQPDIRIACDQSYTRPAWGSVGAAYDQMDLPEGVHLTEDRRLYTFTKALVTCPRCKPLPSGSDQDPVSA